MNVAQISTINGSVTEGTSMRVSGLSRGLHGMGHSVITICASGSENLAGNFEKTDFRLVRLLIRLYGPWSPLESQFMDSAHLRSIAYRMISPLPQLSLDVLNSCSILHCHQHWAASIAERKKRIGNQRLLFDYHGMIFPTDVNGAVIEQVENRSYSKVSKWEQRIFHEADMISFVTARLRDRIVDQNDIDIEKTCVIPDGVDYTHISEGWSKDAVSRLRISWGAENATIVMYIGTLDSLHGGNYLMEVVCELLARTDIDPGLKCIIVGVGSQTDEFAQLQTRFPGRLMLVPGVSYSWLPTYLAAADILLVPHPRNQLMDSIESGKLLTYLASGKPTVVTGLTSVRSYLDDGVNSVLSNPDSPSTMVNGIERLAKSPELQKRIGSQGSMLVKGSRDWSCVARTCTDVYDLMISR